MTGTVLSGVHLGVALLGLLCKPIYIMPIYISACNIMGSPTYTLTTPLLVRDQHYRVARDDRVDIVCRLNEIVDGDLVLHKLPQYYICTEMLHDG